MGYTTDFTGKFKITPPLKPEDNKFLTKFSRSRRIARKLGPEFGVDGEFYVDSADDGNFGQSDRTGVIDFNRHPSTQPGLWCQWTPSEDGQFLQWDGGEKFYDYTEWLKYLIDKILAPRGYVLNGEVQWQGEESNDFGVLIAKENKVFTRSGQRSYGDEQPA